MMKPLDVQIIGDELAIKWDDETETFIGLQKLRLHCPCAGCKGEMDVMGNGYRGPEKKLTDASFRLLRVDKIGTYALQPVWADGHMTGIFSFEYLKRVGELTEPLS